MEFSRVLDCKPQSCFIIKNDSIRDNSLKLMSFRWSFFQQSYKPTVFRLQLCYKENSLQILFRKCTKNQLFKKNKKSIFLRRRSIVGQYLNKAAALQYTTLNFIKKAELMQDLPAEAQKVLIYSQVNHLWWRHFFIEVADVQISSQQFY